MSHKNAKRSLFSVALKVCVGFVIYVIAVSVVLVGVLLYTDNFSSSSARLMSALSRDSSSDDALEDEMLYSGLDVSNWTNEQLAAQLLFIMAPSDDPVGFYLLAQQGIGAIALSGEEPAANMVEELEAAQNEARGGLRMLVASDEEGGKVARLTRFTGTLPAPAEIALWSESDIRKATKAHGERLSDAGVHAVLAPTLDLMVPDTYMTKWERTFSEDPEVVATVGLAWAQGMYDAGLAVCPKHWPGIGSALDTHSNTTYVHDLAILEREDLIPFDAIIDAGAQMIMIGHVIVPGLTEPDTPVTLSPKAYRYLRDKSNPDLIIITDCLDMAGARERAGFSSSEAAVVALGAGADMIMVGALDIETVLPALTSALDSNELSRQQVEISVQRLLRLKRQLDLLP